ncbi:hypothetical protein H9P43_004491 [Blastocladiella emersonii ATCC 22665]|nr:hypothetical protein H9P43_004491 [Blastocladiella emersonii ATCC 22665]
MVTPAPRNPRLPRGAKQRSVIVRPQQHAGKPATATKAKPAAAATRVSATTPAAAAPTTPTPAPAPTTPAPPAPAPPSTPLPGSLPPLPPTAAAAPPQPPVPASSTSDRPPRASRSCMSPLRKHDSAIDLIPVPPPVVAASAAGAGASAPRAMSPPVVLDTVPPPRTLPAIIVSRVITLVGRVSLFVLGLLGGGEKGSKAETKEGAGALPEGVPLLLRENEVPTREDPVALVKAAEVLTPVMAESLPPDNDAAPAPVLVEPLPPDDAPVEPSPPSAPVPPPPSNEAPVAATPKTSPPRKPPKPKRARKSAAAVAPAPPTAKPQADPDLLAVALAAVRASLLSGTHTAFPPLSPLLDHLPADLRAGALAAVASRIPSVLAAASTDGQPWDLAAYAEHLVGSGPAVARAVAVYLAHANPVLHAVLFGMPTSHGKGKVTMSKTDLAGLVLWLLVSLAAGAARDVVAVVDAAVDVAEPAAWVAVAARVRWAFEWAAGRGIDVAAEQVAVGRTLASVPGGGGGVRALGSFAALC